MSLRRANKVIVVLALVAILVDVMRPYPNVWVLAACFAAIVLAIVGGLERVEQVRGESIEDPYDRDELRRRRGAAGWEKPVRPPSTDARPGGLPPRNRGRGYVDTDPDNGKLYPCSWCGSTESVCPWRQRGSVSCFAGRPQRIG